MKWSPREIESADELAGTTAMACGELDQRLSEHRVVGSYGDIGDQQPFPSVIAVATGVRRYQSIVNRRRFFPILAPIIYHVGIPYIQTSLLAELRRRNISVDDVIFREAALPSAQPTARRRPLCPGISVGHQLVTAGTIGAVVFSGGLPFLLSNNHVLAATDLAMVGDPILQPGPHDGGRCPRDTVGALAYWVPLRKSGNIVDAALADIRVSARVQQWYQQPVRAAHSGPPEELLGARVHKFGRTTRFTTGLVEGVKSRRLFVNYGFRGMLGFEHQTIIQGATVGTPFSDGGDSGALVWTDDAAVPGVGKGQALAIGILFAGDSSNDQTYVNPWGALSETLGIAFK